ncbi:hypothetical protein EVAR_67926_1 [Eumeta japonica]|uniref:Uncharacterized protein n=1 Tax=Eumeta variegata TaxID=151549 RepID=A0A4C1ZMK4_EUMVA|nr:hypothetical protein EVAR_67926_1 [Eumeta japonica]
MKKNASRIETVEEMRYLRRCGRRKICRNGDVRERCGLKEDVVIRAERGVFWLSGKDGGRLTKQIHRANMYYKKVALEHPKQTRFVAYSRKTKFSSTGDRRARMKISMDVREAREICNDRTV